MRFKIIWIVLLLPLFAHARPGFFEPWGKDADLCHPVQIQESPPPPSSLAVRMAEKVIRFHQTVLSPIDGPRSHFKPSSSQYMLQAMQKHGFFTGFALGCDRLLRENGADWVYGTIEAEGKLFKYNPVP